MLINVLYYCLLRLSYDKLLLFLLVFFNFFVIYLFYYFTNKT
nr:MAG TPA: hypothetical protein [Caudoviricetes sp.]